MDWYLLVSFLLDAIKRSGLTDQVATNIAQQVKEAIPGHAIEPHMADFLLLVAQKLKENPA